MPGSILRNASAPMVTTLTSLNQPQYQNQAQYNQAQYQTQYQNQAQVQYNQIPKVRTTGSVGAQNVQGFSERNQYGQYPSDFEPGYGAIGSSANASEGEDTLSGGFDDFDEDDEDEDEDVLVRGSDDRKFSFAARINTNNRFLPPSTNTQNQGFQPSHPC